MATHLPVSKSMHASQKSNKAELLLQFCKDNGVLFCDKQFPNNNVSLFQSPPHPEYVRSKTNWNFSWARPAKVLGGYHLFVDDPSPNDIRQGYLGDCYLLCSIASLAEQPTLIRRLFHFPDVNPHGVLGVWLFINGKWKLVIVDEYFPAFTHPKDRSLRFAFTYTKNKEIWVLAIEKAYAKAYGSYYDICGGCPFWTLRELTGAPFEVVDDFRDEGVVWKKVLEAVANNFVLAASSAQGAYVESKNKEGIASSHAYSVLDAREVRDARGRPRRIVQLRNPWGKYEWNGEFSDNSPLWTPELRKKLNVQVSDDGVFWMPWSQFIRFYAEMSILRVRPGFVNNCLEVKRVEGLEKTVVRMHVREPRTTATLSIDQIDSRCVDRPDYDYSFFRVTVARIDENDTLDFIGVVCDQERNIFLQDLDLLRGDYVVLVEVYWVSGYAKGYTFGTYSDSKIDLEFASGAAGVYSQAERMIWQSFAVKFKDKMNFVRNSPVYARKEKPPMAVRSLTDPRANMQLYAYYNKGEGGYAEKVKFEFPIEYTTEIVAAVVTPGKAEIQVNPGDVDVLLRKVNPVARSKRNRPPFTLTPGRQDIVATKYEFDRHTIQQLKPPAKTFIDELDGPGQGDVNADGNLVTKEEKERERLVDQERKLLIQQSLLEVLQKKKLMEEFARSQVSLLEQFGDYENQQIQQLNLSNGHGQSNFFIISESIRNMDIPKDSQLFLGPQVPLPTPTLQRSQSGELKGLRAAKDDFYGTRGRQA